MVNWYWRRASGWCAGALAGAWALLGARGASALSVYHIGNSLVLQNEQRVVIQALAIEAGRAHTYSMSVILGAPLAYIWSHPDASGGWEGQVYPSGLSPSRSWDALVLEPYDRDFHFYPYDDPKAPGYDENDVQSADDFYQLALAGNSRSQLYIYEIFPTQSGWVTIPEQRTLAHALTVAEQVNKLHPSAAPVVVIPAGDVIQKLGALADQGQLPHIAAHTALYGDEDHLNEVGSYAVALTHLACLYRDDPHVYSDRPVYPSGSDYPPGTAIWRDVSEYELLAPLGGAVWPETAAVIKDVVAQVTANTPRSGLDGGVRIATTSLPPGVVARAYSTQLTGALGTPPYRWSISAGALPPGLRLENDTIVGVPTAAASAAFTVLLADSSTPARSVTQSFTIGVSTADAAFEIAAGALPNATRGTRLAQPLAAMGGVAPIRWAVESGRLPFGVTLSADGVLQGSPGEEGSFAFSVVATDSTPGVARTAQRSFSLAVAPLGAATVVARQRVGTCAAAQSLLGRWLFTNSAAKPVGTSDNQVRFAALWDEQYLHVAIEVHDATVVPALGPLATSGDAVELYVNADNGKGTIYGARDRRVVVGANGDKWLPDGRDAGIVTAVVPASNGYTVELAIPWSNLGVTAQANLTLGFDIANRDDDGAGRAGARYWYGGAEDESRPSAWGNLFLGPPTEPSDAGTCDARVGEDAGATWDESDSGAAGPIVAASEDQAPGVVEGGANHGGTIATSSGAGDAGVRAPSADRAGRDGGDPATPPSAAAACSCATPGRRSPPFAAAASALIAAMATWRRARRGWRIRAC